MSARVIQVIETCLERRGNGTEASPIRIVRQYWTFDGELLAEVDPSETTIVRISTGDVRDSTDPR